MARIVDYASLSTAIQTITHRASLAPYIDYFIQGAEERIYSKILELNEGEGLRWMEAPLSLMIDGISGQAPVPIDYISMKNATLAQDSSIYDLIVKEPQWIRSRYSDTQGTGTPAYIARDVNAIFVGSIANGLLTISQQLSGSVGVGQPLFGPNILPGVSILSAAGPPGQWNLGFSFGVQDDIDTTAVTVDTPAVTIDNIAVDGDTMTTGGFIFGPFPDNAYSVGGVYYQKAAPLTSANSVTWMVSQIPFVLLDACLAEVAKFLKDQEGESGRMQSVTDRLGAMVMADKAERYAGGSLVINCA